MKLSEVVRRLVRLGEVSREYWDRELPKRHPHYPVIRDGEDPVPSPPEDAEIEAVLQSLPEEQLYALMLLAYIGRGDSDAEHLASGRRAVRDAIPTRALAIAQLMGEKALAEYLTDALEELQKRGVDVDSHHFEHAVAVGR